MMQSPKNNFTARDIERYHAGQMSATERHALEKAALDDPFLSDALEGYTYTTSSTQDLENIRQRLEQKSRPKKPVLIFMNSTVFRAAAIFVLVAGTAWFAFRYISIGKNDLALEKTPVPTNQVQKNNDLTIAPTLSDSIKSGIDSLTKTFSSNLATADSTTQSATNSYSFNQGTVKDIRTTPEETVDEVSRKKNAVEVENITAVTTEKANARYRNAEPVTNVPANNRYDDGAINRNQSNMNRAMPDLNNSNLPRRQNDLDSRKTQNAYPRNDSMVEKEYVFNDNSRDKAKATDTLRNFDVVLKPSPLPTNEVIVMSEGKESYTKQKKSHVIIDTLEPTGGRARYDDYVAANIREPEELKFKSADSREVQLSFDVNKNGEPVNITVVKSLCEKCDQEAIRLLKEGPKWKKKKNRKGKVTIRF